jgi:hypothetical protein
MKFILPQPAPRPAIDTSLRIGNVYPCKGGGKTHYWIVVGLSERTVNLLGINSDGQVTSTANYGAHVFEGSVGFPGRDLLGHCGGMEALEFDITWFRGGRDAA